MTAFRIVMRFGVLLCVLTASLSADSVMRPQNTLAARKQIEAGLSNGNGLVLIIAENGAIKPDDESYGDWADNLNRFASSSTSGIKLVRMTPAMYGRLALGPKFKERYATVFVRDASHALVYEGTIVEQKVYKLGSGYIEAGKTADLSRTYEAVHQKELLNSGLVETRLQLIRLK